MKNCSVILAAGQGTRMKTARPKAMTQVLFKPMLDWVIGAARNANVKDICVVTGFAAEEIENHLDSEIVTVRQKERRGTGHAVMQAADFIKAHSGGNVLILSGDAPFMDSDTISMALSYHCENNAAATVISAKVDDPFGYGRIVRDRSGCIRSIVEQASADEKTQLINEVNSGAYWFDADALLETLSRITPNNSKGEYYLTDAIDIIIKSGKKACAFAAENQNTVLGANTRVQLNQLNEIARKDILERLMLDGVDIPCTDGVIVGPDVTIGGDTQILPNTIICGNVTIGSDCVIGPNSFIENAQIGDAVVFNNSQIRNAKIMNGATIGPFVQIRPDSEVGARAHLGNFVEVKNSVIGENTHVSHLTYVGDSDVGSNVNFGCGVVTVNFNGKDKNRCTIKDGAFIGCNTNLVAPVTVGEYSYTAAGSTITDDVPDKSLGIGRARQVNKDGWVDKKQPYRKKV